MNSHHPRRVDGSTDQRANEHLTEFEKFAELIGGLIAEKWLASTRSASDAQTDSTDPANVTPRTHRS